MPRSVAPEHKKVSTPISLPLSMVQALDAYAATVNIGRSELVQRAVHDYLNGSNGSATTALAAVRAVLDEYGSN